MQLSTIVHPISTADKWLQRRRKERSLREQEHNFARIVSIAAEYGYHEDSTEVRTIWDDCSFDTRDAILRWDFKEEDWRAEFNPADSLHVRYRNEVPVIMNFPMSIELFKKHWGAPRADVVRAYLPEGWEQSCNRIIIQSHETTFFKDKEPLVIFYASGRKMHGGSWARVWNALDAVKTYIGIEIDPNDVAIPDCSTYPDYVIEKNDDTWTWPTRQAA